VKKCRCTLSASVTKIVKKSVLHKKILVSVHPNPSLWNPAQMWGMAKYPRIVRGSVGLLRSQTSPLSYEVLCMHSLAKLPTVHLNKATTHMRHGHRENSEALLHVYKHSNATVFWWIVTVHIKHPSSQWMTKYAHIRHVSCRRHGAPFDKAWVHSFKGPRIRIDIFLVWSENPNLRLRSQ